MTESEELFDTEQSNVTERRFGGLMPWLAVCAVGFGLLTSVVTAWTIYTKEEKVILREFEVDIGERIDTFERELKLNIEALHALKVLFGHGSNASPTEFAVVARDILVRHDSIQALEWIPRVPHNERTEFVKRQQVDFPDFKFTERLDQGLMTKAKERKNLLSRLLR